MGLFLRKHSEITTGDGVISEIGPLNYIKSNRACQIVKNPIEIRYFYKYFNCIKDNYFLAFLGNFSFDILNNG